jgi:hypothetical protein
MRSSATIERARARSCGFVGLFGWATLGLGLEAAHGLKLAGYLDDELARDLLRLAHAHGVLLSIVCLVYAQLGVPLLAARADAGRALRRLLVAAWLLMPCGFALGAIAHSEADPGPGIWLVPAGGLCLVVALGWLALASIRHKDADDGPS